MKSKLLSLVLLIIIFYTSVTLSKIPALAHTPNTAPTTSITAPTNNSYVLYNSQITISASASDPNTDAIKQVDFYLDASTTSFKTITLPPYSFQYTANSSIGAHTLKTKATDIHGAVGTSASITVNIKNPPTVSLTSPTGGAVLDNSTTATISATASDSVGVSKVDFYLDSTSNPPIGNDTTSPYSVSWIVNATDGNHPIIAKVTDTTGFINTDQKSVTINTQTTAIDPSLDNQTLTINTPITLKAEAVDTAGTLSTVQFFNGATNIGTATQCPLSLTCTSYRYRLDWTPTTFGSFQIVSKATNSNNFVTTSTPITIIVNDLAPTADIQANSSQGPATIDYNNTATLSWSSTHATSCTVTPGNWTGTSSVGQSTGNLIANTTYSISCSGSGGTATDSVVVNVNPPPPTLEVTDDGQGYYKYISSKINGTTVDPNSSNMTFTNANHDSANGWTWENLDSNASSITITMEVEVTNTGCTPIYAKSFANNAKLYKDGVNIGSTFSTYSNLICPFQVTGDVGSTTGSVTNDRLQIIGPAVVASKVTSAIPPSQTKGTVNQISGYDFNQTSGKDIFNLKGAIYDYYNNLKLNEGKSWNAAVPPNSNLNPAPARPGGGVWKNSDTSLNIGGSYTGSGTLIIDNANTLNINSSFTGVTGENDTLGIADLKTCSPDAIPICPVVNINTAYNSAVKQVGLYAPFATVNINTNFIDWTGFIIAKTINIGNNLQDGGKIAWSAKLATHPPPGFNQLISALTLNETAPE